MLDQNQRPSPVVPTVDFDADGVQHGFLRLPWSRDDSAWGSVMIPVAVIRNGQGPTALLTGANHGDEYEGPLALYELARTLKPQDVTGAVVIVPAGMRTAPPIGFFALGAAVSGAAGLMPSKPLRAAARSLSRKEADMTKKTQGLQFEQAPKATLLGCVPSKVFRIYGARVPMFFEKRV